MTRQESILFLQQMERVFDTVRLVDATLRHQLCLDEKGELRAEPYRCYAFWNRSQHCENCIAAKAFSQRAKLTKFEFVGSDIYHVVAMPIEIEENSYVLELIMRITEDTLLSACGENSFVEAVSAHNRKLYLDALTGAHNRQYYEEQLRIRCDRFAVAMMDADSFKQINDRYGHAAGDIALRAIVEAVKHCIRGSDVVIRYGGDEFLLVFREIPAPIFATRLEQIRQRVSEFRTPEYPDLRISVSIGGIYGEGTVEDLACRADERLYQAKVHKNTVSLDEYRP